MSKGFKAAALIIAIVTVVFSSFIGVMSADVMSSMSFGEVISTDSVDRLSSTGENVGLVNALLIGTDKEGLRSDTIMLVSFDDNSNRVNILSIPRDTRVELNGHTEKINAAFGLGMLAAEEDPDVNDEDMLIDEVKKITGMPIHYFITINVDGFVDVIDALGGVDFNVPYDMDYDDPAQDLHIHLEAGEQHLDGQAAHDFVRFRHNNDNSAPGEYVMGDEGRIYWQQKFMEALAEQKLKPEYISKVDDLFDVIRENVRTNLAFTDIMRILNAALDVDLSEMESYQLPGESAYIGGVWYYIYDEQETSQLVGDVFKPKSLAQWEEEKALRQGQELLDAENSDGGESTSSPETE